MKRRDFLLRSGAVTLVSAFPLGWAKAAEGKKHRVLYFTRSAGYEHSPVKPLDGGPSYSDKVLTRLGKENNVEVVCTKDGTVFDGDLDQYDAIAFYTCGDLCNPKSTQNTPPMSPEEKKKLLAWVAAGGGSSDSIRPATRSTPRACRTPSRRSRTAIPTSRCSAASSSCMAPSRWPRCG